MEQKHSNYFEGILQLRNPNKEVINYINNKANDQISKIKDVKGGIDFYFISQKVLKAFGPKLQRRFGGEVITSAKIHTRDRMSGKELYRVNLLFRIPFFKVGDIIEIKGNLYKVSQIGKNVSAKDLDTGKKSTFRYRDLPK
ncbi:NMD3-related protein [Nanoarchaeota archaeon]